MHMTSPWKIDICMKASPPGNMLCTFFALGCIIKKLALIIIDTAIFLNDLASLCIDICPKDYYNPYYNKMVITK